LFDTFISLFGPPCIGAAVTEDYRISTSYMRYCAAHNTCGKFGENGLHWPIDTVWTSSGHFDEQRRFRCSINPPKTKAINSWRKSMRQWTLDSISSKRTVLFEALWII